jgi:hypothetical protein
MTAYPITLKTRTAFPKTGYASILVDGTADTALAAITTSSTVGDVLDILNALVARKLVTDENQIGLASSVLWQGVRLWYTGDYPLATKAITGSGAWSITGLSATAERPGTVITYQWQKSANGTSGWANVSGETDAALTDAGAAAGDAGYYRCAVTGTFGGSTEVVYSRTVQVTHT